MPTGLENKSETVAVSSSAYFLKPVKAFFEEVTAITRFAFRFFKELFMPRYELKELIRQSYLLGYKSLPLIAVTGFIMGIVLIIQSRPTLASFGAESWLPAMVSVSIIREMGPAIAALIFAGKVGSGIAAELASMKVTEQIDAMEVSGINPFKYIVVTRIIAATIMLPVLVILSDAISLYGGFLAVNLKGDISLHLYFSQVFQALAFTDIFPAFIKTIFFGFAVGLIGCYYGYNSAHGTEGVGKAANQSFVYGSISIFVLDMMAVQITSFFI
jgi:phospholipid/cholesterol/gamma-HCH transport system permease protein